MSSGKAKKENRHKKGLRMEPDILQSTTKQRVLIFPAQTPKILNRPVYFLFSLVQMEDVIMDAAVHPVPFSPPYIEGVAEWRDHVVPVLSLEGCLGLKPEKSQKARRLMVVRVAKKEITKVENHRSMLRVVPPIRMATLPIECTPVSVGWIPDKNLVKGIYEWEKGFLVVTHTEKILLGGNGSKSENIRIS